MRTSNYTTALLVVIVIILLFGVGIAIYYVLDLDWFEAKQLEIYTQNDLNDVVQTQVDNNYKYDLSKRMYNMKLSLENIELVVYKDGSVGVTLTDNKTNEQVAIYKENLNKEIKVELTNIIRAYEISVSKDTTPKKYIVLLDIDGNLYKTEKEQIVTYGNHKFSKIEGLAKIVDVVQITNEELAQNTNGINAIAIDSQNNELLLTNYLLTEK